MANEHIASNTAQTKHLGTKTVHPYRCLATSSSHIHRQLDTSTSVSAAPHSSNKSGQSALACTFSATHIPAPAAKLYSGTPHKPHSNVFELRTLYTSRTIRYSLDLGVICSRRGGWMPRKCFGGICEDWCGATSWLAQEVITEVCL